MDINDLPSVVDLVYAMGEILTTTWPGRIILGAIIGALLTKFSRL